MKELGQSLALDKYSIKQAYKRQTNKQTKGQITPYELLDLEWFGKWYRMILFGFKITIDFVIVTAGMKLKDTWSLEEKLWQT